MCAIVNKIDYNKYIYNICSTFDSVQAQPSHIYLYSYHSSNSMFHFQPVTISVFQEQSHQVYRKYLWLFLFCPQFSSLFSGSGSVFVHFQHGPQFGYLVWYTTSSQGVWCGTPDHHIIFHRKHLPFFMMDRNYNSCEWKAIWKRNLSKNWMVCCSYLLFNGFLYLYWDFWI